MNPTSIAKQFNVAATCSTSMLASPQSHRLKQVKPQRRRSRGQRRGSIMTLTMFLLPVLLFLVGMAVDISQLQLHRAELRVAVDAASRAAADELARSENANLALQRAIEVAAANQVAGQPLQLLTSDVEFGSAESNDAGRWIFTANTTPFNSVRVNGVRAAGRQGGSLPLTFSRVLGQNGIDSQMASVATFRTIDIVLVLDRSTSMKLDVTTTQQGMFTSDPRFCSAPRQSSRWVALQNAVNVFINELNQTPPEENVALVTFGDVIPWYFCGGLPAARRDVSLTENLPAITGMMNFYSNSVWNGNTDIRSGIDFGREALAVSNGARTLSEKVMIVMTDGHATTGNTLQAAQRAANQNIKISTITFGIGADQAMMQAVAQIGSGIHLHANSTDELAEVFRQLAARDAMITD